MTDHDSVEATLEHLRERISAYFTHLEELSRQLLAVLKFDGDSLSITDSVRSRLKSIAVAFLATDETIDGCGLIFAHSALGTANGHLEWWVREDESRFARYSFGVVPGADRYYDYERLEWFTRAFHEGTPALVGPYIDYLGVEAYVLTLTVPAEIDGTRIGAVGNDVQLHDLERELMPALLAADTDMVLLNRYGNVLLSNSSRFLPGEYIPETPEGFSRRRLTPSVDELEVLFRA